MFDLKVNGINEVMRALQSLFSAYGYSEYKMNKFEEYDLYVKNKDFLISPNVITFTDTNGKLLALKPDVTLSIVKNTKLDNGLNKVFYNENVYRVSSKSNGYKEISQVGLECIGELDDFNLAEVITLAGEGLKIISGNPLLDLSPVGILSSFVDSLRVSNGVKNEIYRCVNEKNTHELKDVLQRENISSNDSELLTALTELYGEVDEVLPKLKKLFEGSEQLKAVYEFESVLDILSEDIKSIIRIDCSSCENVKYYNGITFRGYIEGIPKAVLSGGRYDGLLKRMGKNSGAIGFAVYPDEFDRLYIEREEYDVDVLVLYGDKANKKELISKIQALTNQGKRVTALKQLPQKLTYREIIEIKE